MTVVINTKTLDGHKHAIVLTNVNEFDYDKSRYAIKIQANNYNDTHLINYVTDVKILSF
jgi:hypothetical protein